MSASRERKARDLILEAKLAIARARIAVAQRSEEATVALGSSLGRFGRRLVLRLHRHEEIALPEPFVVGDHRFDVMTDLRRYTELPLERVEALVKRRADSFRAEWFLTPPGQRFDNWFYLSSTTYLFGNAAHDAVPVLDAIHQTSAGTGRALDFGGGAGNLALGLAASGWSVDFVERSALQKDFVTFRVMEHGMTDSVRVLHNWQPLEVDAYDLVCAIDVLEHVEQLRSLLRENLLPAIRLGGALVESSPFSRTLSNPMHYEHSDLEETLVVQGFALERSTANCRIWRRLRA